MSYKLTTLYSGSGGNSTLVCAGNTKILIDAGKSAKALCTSLRSVGSDISEISAIFITHEHCDHISALETLCKRNSIPVHMTEGSAKKLDRTPDSHIHTRLVRHDTLYSVCVGELTVSSFRTPHDSNMSVGYRIEWQDGEGAHALGVATDIGYVTDSIKKGLLGCEAVVLESNHDEEMLMSGPYPYTLKLRIASNKGHLCNSECARLACFLANEGTKGFILAHLSEENNIPSLAYDETVGAIADASIKICVASPVLPTELIME